MVSSPEFFMQRALLQAQSAASQDEVPVGAVLVLQNQIVEESGNQREKTHRTAGHAEMELLDAYNRKSAAWRLPPGAALYVTVEPCLMCVGALIWARLDHLFYGCSDTKNAGLTRLLPLIEDGIYDHKFKSVTNGLMGAECAEVMSSYFRNKRLEKKSASGIPNKPE